MPLVRPDTVWVREMEVEETSCQEPYSVSLLAFCWNCQPLRVPSPVTELVRVSLPLPTLVATVGVVAVPGLVRKAEAEASSLASVQVLSL